MKIFKIYLKSVALFCTMLIFFQSCTFYKTAPISIEQAVQNENKVKVITKSGENFKFDSIGTEEGNYYGVKGMRKKVKTVLDENSIDTIKEKDKTLSLITSIGGPIIFPALILILVISSSSGRGLNGK